MELELLDIFGNEQMIVNAARVSFEKFKKQEQPEPLTEGDRRLIRYLAAHEHWSPFAHPTLQYRIRAPIFIARQWFKHMIGISRNEVSRRYVKSDPEFYTPTVLRRQAEKAKQGSRNEAVKNSDQLLTAYKKQIAAARLLYQRMIAKEVCPEQARMVLPQSMYTTWIESATLYATIRIVLLRTDSHAQKEIQELASQLAEILQTHFPISYDAFFGANSNKSTTPN